MVNPFYKAIIWFVVMIFSAVFSLGYIPYPYNFIVSVALMLYIVKRIIDIFIRVEEIREETQRVRKPFMGFNIGFRDFIPAVVIGVLILVL